MSTDFESAMSQVSGLQADNSHTASVQAIREILAKQGALSVDVQTLDEETDLYSVGLTSLATVGIMLALEDRFDVELPESMLSRTTFRSIAAMAEAVAKLSQ